MYPEVAVRRARWILFFVGQKTFVQGIAATGLKG